ncbi:acyl-CoA carboxylase subunit beta [Meiothermus granaticius]|uniref:Methylmalonyl-CoA carboxyltransferase 12S subunit n=1 Tax=Meiothermus granaticius NBRC 107808 TaxID=1227551 RepID=A0A399FCP4_9DEIN|nr:acyl-CoA carboxylase subunit beta [Meiothermus granaticius]RIH94028.1 Methylmalonyl-CoA carboxyltransferase 12S subunit [Meiothermus granaticius NBRC 107808]GEM88482.1 propionyl-CoA carboxylase subunit beta [Meiothermus granaticius NBRC 107808]
MLETAIGRGEREAPTFKANKDAWVRLMAEFHGSLEKIRQGGGSKAIERQHARGRLSARERIAKLVDAGTELEELLTYAGWGMYEDWGGAPGGGVVVGIGKIAGRDWMIVANDATVKAGAFFPITAKKVIRAQTLALENRIPTVYLVDSAGVFLPLQDEVFPDQDDFGRIFYLNARMSALGIPQISAIMGNCVAGGAYLPLMTDVLIMTEGSGLYLAGPALVKAAIGQEVSSEELGGARMHAEVSGTVDFYEPNDEAALERIRSLAGMYAAPEWAPWARERHPEAEPIHPQEDLYGLVSPDGNRPYEVREVIARLVDASRFAEFKASYGQTLVCGYARLGGFPIGIVANQRSVIKKPDKIEVGGVIYAEAADKAARFILEVNQRFIPLVFLMDVTGFMVGKESEQHGIIRRGAKLVNAVSNSVVPKITLIIGGSFGAGNYAMAGKAYGPRFIYAWPSAKYAVMGGASAAKTLMEIEVGKLEREGKVPTDQDLKELYERIKGRYDEQLDPRYAAARLWVDEVIFPHQTRERLIRSLEACALNPTREAMGLGVFQV